MLRIVFAILPIALLLAACTQKDLVYPGIDKKVEVRFNWENAPDANPEGMSLIFYPADSESKLWRFEIAGREGGTIEIPQGNYHLLAVNNDVRNVEYLDTDNLYGISANIPVKNDEAQPVGGMIYTGIIFDITVGPCGVRYSLPGGGIKECQAGLIRCSPVPVCTKYHLVVNGVEHANTIYRAYCTVAGLPASISLMDKTTSGNSITIKAPLGKSSKATDLVSEYFAFPPYADNSPVYADIIFTDGRDHFWRHQFDVTDQVVNAPDINDIYIYVSASDFPGFENPIDPGGDGGIDVGVDGWNEINIDISTDL